MKTFINKIQDKKLIQGLVTAIAFISFSIALSSSTVSQKFNLLFNIMPYLTKLVYPSLILGLIFLIWYLGWALFTPYSPVDKKAVALHISGRIKGVLYDAHGALKYYRKAQEELAQADEKLQKKGKKRWVAEEVKLIDLKGIILIDKSSAHQMLSQHNEAMTNATESYFVYDRLRQRYGDEIELSQIGKSRAFATAVSSCFYSNSFSSNFNDTNEDSAEYYLVETLKIASPNDPLLNKNSVNFKLVPRKLDLIFDPYGASKAHCMYSWCLLPENPVDATWHAEMALFYAQKIPYLNVGDILGTRDGQPIGRIWRELVAYFTLGDCWLLRNNPSKAEDYYRMPWGLGRMARRIISRREYYTGHWFWLFLLQMDGYWPIYGFRSIWPLKYFKFKVELLSFNQQQSKKWLYRVRKLAEKDRYLFRLALADLHIGDFYLLVENDKNSSRMHWEKSFKCSKSHNIPHLAKQAAMRIENNFDVLKLYKDYNLAANKAIKVTEPPCFS